MSLAIGAEEPQILIAYRAIFFLSDIQALSISSVRSAPSAHVATNDSLLPPYPEIFSIRPGPALPCLLTASLQRLCELDGRLHTCLA